MSGKTTTYIRTSCPPPRDKLAIRKEDTPIVTDTEGFIGTFNSRNRPRREPYTVEFVIDALLTRLGDEASPILPIGPIRDTTLIFSVT